MPPWKPVYWPWNAAHTVLRSPELHSHSGGLFYMAYKQSNKAESKALGSVTFCISIP